MPRDPFQEMPHGNLARAEKNPFAADSSTAPRVDDGVKTPLGAAVAALPAGYQLVQRHRAALTYTLGLVGLVITALGSLALYWVPLLPVLGVPFTVAAWLIGRSELEGMRRGLIDDSGAARARRGMWFGLVGTCIVAVELMGALLYVLYWLYAQF